MRYRYLVMEREYGSGATQIGGHLAEEMGIPCYGRQILEAVAKDYHVPVEQIESYEEKATNSFLYSVYLTSKMYSTDDNKASVEDNIYLAEQRVIQKMAAPGPCIFIGHCAAQALKDRKDVLRVFIHAGQDVRLERAVKEYGIAQADAERVLRKFDKKRSNYYKANNDAEWKDFGEYDMVLNSETLGIDGCVDILKKQMA